MKDFRQKASLNGKTIELINRISDPAMWVVNIYKKFLFFEKKENSYWFSDKDEAEIFYNKLTND
ncbi:MAG: hypothetical protein WAT71_17620 [Ignavibacteria bacterium]